MPSKNKYKQNAISKLNYVNLNMKIFLILNIIEGNLQFNQKYNVSACNPRITYEIYLEHDFKDRNR